MTYEYGFNESFSDLLGTDPARKFGRYWAAFDISKSQIDQGKTPKAFVLSIWNCGYEAGNTIASVVQSKDGRFWYPIKVPHDNSKKTEVNRYDFIELLAGRFARKKIKLLGLAREKRLNKNGKEVFGRCAKDDPFELGDFRRDVGGNFLVELKFHDHNPSEIFRKLNFVNPSKVGEKYKDYQVVRSIGDLNNRRDLMEIVDERIKKIYNGSTALNKVLLKQRIKALKDSINNFDPVLDRYRRVACSTPDRGVIYRNPDIVELTLLLARGKCNKCKRDAPFHKPNGQPYLEVHHILPLSQGGLDEPNNVEALCPNCHREKHFGSAAIGRETGD